MSNVTTTMKDFLTYCFLGGVPIVVGAAIIRGVDYMYDKIN